VLAGGWVAGLSDVIEPPVAGPSRVPAFALAGLAVAVGAARIWDVVSDVSGGRGHEWRG
jgi:hypothetical protein